MAAPAQALDLGNLALLKLYQKPISSADEDSDPARIFNVTYDQTRQSLLRKFSWNFAKVRGSLTLKNVPAVVSMDGFSTLYTYQMPNDLLRLLSIGWDSQTRYNPIRYDVQGRTVLIDPCQNGLSSSDVAQGVNPGTPLNAIDILYISDYSDVTQMDALFRDVLIYGLALEMCMPVTGDAQLALLLRKEFDLLLQEAQGINYQEKPMMIIESDPILNSRMMTGGYYPPDSEWG